MSSQIQNVSSDEIQDDDQWLEGEQRRFNIAALQSDPLAMYYFLWRREHPEPTDTGYDSAHERTSGTVRSISIALASGQRDRASSVASTDHRPDQSAGR